MTYQEALAYIASLEPRGWRLGLDRMFELVRRADLTAATGHADKPKFIHIAGTNGKGTTTAFVQSILTAHGFRTGAFFSPFVYDPRERIQVDGRLISEDSLAELTERLIPIADTLSGTEFGGITEFEFKTALGFMYWAEQKCDWVALEVGLGGRFDATNVVTPEASAITSIGLDHTAILGRTLGAIAFEKAGVIKPGVPVVLGELPDEASDVAEKLADELQSPVWRHHREFDFTSERDGLFVRTPSNEFARLVPGMGGDPVAWNMAIAIAACEAAGVDLSATDVRRAVAETMLPGRFELRTYEGRLVVLDGAHNADAARELRRSIERAGFGRAVVLTSMVQGHDPMDFYRELAPVTAESHFVPLAFHRAVPPVELAAGAGHLFSATHVHETVEAGIEAALASNEGDFVLVTGSFYLVGEVGKSLATAYNDSR